MWKIDNSPIPVELPKEFGSRYISVKTTTTRWMGLCRNHHKQLEYCEGYMVRVRPDSWKRGQPLCHGCKEERAKRADRKRRHKKPTLTALQKERIEFQKQSRELKQIRHTMSVSQYTKEKLLLKKKFPHVS